MSPRLQLCCMVPETLEGFFHAPFTLRFDGR
jgi:hypothetical protein